MRPIYPTFYALYGGKINGRLGVWADEDGRGACYGRGGRVSTARWIDARGDHLLGAACKINKLSEEERKFLPIAPDFIVEFLRPLYDPDYQLAKMDQWIASGVQVAWLIDPKTWTVTIYQPGESLDL